MSQSSYLERSVFSFFTDKVLGGFRDMTEPRILPFSLVSMGVILLNIIAIALNAQGCPGFDTSLVSKINSAGLLIAGALVTLGPLSAIVKEYRYKFALIFLGIASSILFAFYANPNPAGFSILSMMFVFVWVIISSFSMFFLLFFFFTGFAGKVVTFGKSEDHIFLGPFVNIALLGVAGLSLWLTAALQSAGTIAIGVIGIFASFAFFRFLKKKSGNETRCNFITITGLYLYFAFYHLAGSISPVQNAGSVITELIILIITALYAIQGMAGRAKDVDMSYLEEIERGRKVFFQKKFALIARIKRAFGEISLVLTSIGFATGYFIFVLSMYGSPELPLLIHRLFASASLLITFSMLFIFKASREFREFATNHYTFEQGVRIVQEKIDSLKKNITLGTVLNLLLR